MSRHILKNLSQHQHFGCSDKLNQWIIRLMKMQVQIQRLLLSQHRRCHVPVKAQSRTSAPSFVPFLQGNYSLNSSIVLHAKGSIANIDVELSQIGEHRVERSLRPRISAKVQSRHLTHLHRRCLQFLSYPNHRQAFYMFHTCLWSRSSKMWERIKLQCTMEHPGAQKAAQLHHFHNLQQGCHLLPRVPVSLHLPLPLPLPKSDSRYIRGTIRVIS